MGYIVGRAAGDAEDPHADGRRVDVQEFLHHHGNVPPHAVLRVRRRHPLRVCEVRRRPRQVSPPSTHSIYLHHRCCVLP